MSSSLLPPGGATAMDSLSFTSSTQSSPMPPNFFLLRPYHHLRCRHFRPFVVNATAATSKSTATAVFSAEETLTEKPQSMAGLQRVSADSLQYESGYVGAVPELSDGAAAVSESAMEYLANILSSKVYDVAIESPLQLAEKLSVKLGANILLKREDLQPHLGGRTITE